MNRKSCALYRCFDGQGRLLYVGVSMYAINRLAQHGCAEWFGDVEKITIERFPSIPSALCAEREAISTEAPIHNRLGRMQEAKAA